MKCLTFALCLFLYSCTQDDAAYKKEMLQQAAHKKIKKILAQVAADCEANLQKETYKRVQLLQKQARRPAAKK